MTEPVLTSEIQDNLKELVLSIRITKDSGGFFLVGVSGPAAKKLRTGHEREKNGSGEVFGTGTTVETGVA